MSATFTVDFFCSLDGYGMARGWPGYVLDGRTHKLVYAPHLHGEIPEGAGPQRRNAN